jgi:hypothetical protein
MASNKSAPPNLYSTYKNVQLFMYWLKCMSWIPDAGGSVFLFSSIMVWPMIVFLLFILFWGVWGVMLTSGV